MRVKPLVFLSSTSDLAAERQALRKVLSRWYDPYLYETDRPRRASPEAHCRELIERADVFVGLLGSSYGSPLAPGTEEPSICEWELNTARRQPGSLEILLYLKEVSLDDELDPRQECVFRRMWPSGSNPSGPAIPRMWPGHSDPSGPRAHGAQADAGPPFLQAVSCTSSVS